MDSSIIITCVPKAMNEAASRLPIVERVRGCPCYEHTRLVRHLVVGVNVGKFSSFHFPSELYIISAHIGAGRIA
jgi:hypothetical protein